MARRVFTSFHFQRDIWRANQVRKSWVTKGVESNTFYDASLWEEARRKGDAAIKAMIDKALVGTSVTAVLIGSETADRTYVKYEIQRSHEAGKGLLGVRIHQLCDQAGQTCRRGRNPFEDFVTNIGGRQVLLSSLYTCYDWIDDDGYSNYAAWIEQAARNAGRR